MTNIASVASFLLHSQGDMSTMKLQKLCYFAQGWHLAWRNEPLFDEEFQAWKNGPVCYDLFRLHKGLYNIDLDTLYSRSTQLIPRLTPVEEQYVLAAIDPYKDLSGIQLSEITHDQTPWRDARGGLTPDATSNTVIDKTSIRNCFTSLMARS